MSPKRVAAVALFVALAGCAGFAPTDGTETPSATAPTSTPTETTAETTEPHTGVGTSHTSDHLTVRASAGVQNLSVTLAPDGDSATYEVPAGDELSFTREIHDRGHDVHVVVERGGEVVYEADVLGYEYHQLTVHENDTEVTMAVV
ncbi:MULTISPECIES: hypothetical protein [Halobacterium]|uniref:hypothetical protein n=1 Tax=Halobacterium TaxID=2239 RepID=UPI00073F82C4|nr:MULTISPECIES: hypothetical protein [Halobacterium]MCG1002498.1 hypothetical protein [Halobacterium noricense]